MSLIDYNRFQHAEILYQQSKPFPHIVINDFLEEEFANKLVEEFPSKDALTWWKYDNIFEKKLAFDDFSKFPNNIKLLLEELNGQKFISYLENLTGIANLLPDPSYRGGGMHQILSGGKLDIHADFNIHPVLKLERRLNIILYLNKNWDLSWGGNLEFWDKDMVKCIKSIAPIFNRFVCFNVTDNSNHGHPDPLNCPENESRKSLAIYYYTKPIKKLKSHSTIYKKRPQDSTSYEVEKLRSLRAKGRKS